MVVVEGDEGVVGAGQALHVVTVVYRTKYLVYLVLLLANHKSLITITTTNHNNIGTTKIMITFSREAGRMSYLTVSW